MRIHGDGAGKGGPGAPLLTQAEARAARAFVQRVRREVPAALVQASLFGSKARRQARPDSDVDVLLVFRRLPPDREPHASHAERIADEVAHASGVPVTTWSVSLGDLSAGNRTPMLVDALEDSAPLWWTGEPLPRLPFTPPDALRCVDALLARVSEGSEEFAGHLAAGRVAEATRRGRDDVVRLCTAWLLLRGVTRPRRGDAARRAEEAGAAGALPPAAAAVLRWAAGSYGPDGRDDQAPPPPPPGGARAVPDAIDALRREVADGALRLARRGGSRGTRARFATIL